MKRKILSILLMMAMVFVFTACGGSDESTEATEPTEETMYQNILDDYTQKIKDAVPRLEKEYEEESADLSGDALAELKSDKVAELALICAEGSEEMAKVNEETYLDWAVKLQRVYEEYAEQLESDFE